MRDFVPAQLPESSVLILQKPQSFIDHRNAFGFLLDGVAEESGTEKFDASRVETRRACDSDLLIDFYRQRFLVATDYPCRAQASAEGSSTDTKNLL